MLFCIVHLLQLNNTPAFGKDFFPKNKMFRKTSRYERKQNGRGCRGTLWQGEWRLVTICFLLLALTASTALAHSGPITQVSFFELAPTAESNATFQRLNSLIEQSLSEPEHRLLEDARDGQFDHHTLLEAALIAGGVEDAAVRGRYQQQFDCWVKEIKSESQSLLNQKSSEQELARCIFEYMHRTILTGGYSLHSTNLADIFEQGRFNCVSATLLYCCLAKHFGLDVRGLETVGHAMSCLILPNERIEIESTCPRWFHLASNPQRRAELVEKTIGIRPDDQSKNYRLVSEVELVATIYYNRGLDMLAESNFTGALAANATALTLDPSNQTAHGNLLAVLNNWAISLASTGKYLEAISLLETGVRVDPNFTTFHANILHVHRRWVDELCEELRYGEAIGVLTEGSRRWPNEPWFQTRSERLLHNIGVK